MLPVSLLIHLSTARLSQSAGAWKDIRSGSATIPDLMISKNWLDGGHCTLKLAVRNGWSLTSTVVDNKPGPNRKAQSCPSIANPSINLTERDNVFEAVPGRQ